jgi:hypothetical protein
MLNTWKTKIFVSIFTGDPPKKKMGRKPSMKKLGKNSKMKYPSNRMLFCLLHKSIEFMHIFRATSNIFLNFFLSFELITLFSFLYYVFFFRGT